jgi:hypothetical protein
MLARAAPDMPESYEERQALLQHLPLRLLQRKIEVKAALTQEQITRLHDRVQAGELPCGEDPFPSCERVREFLTNRAHICMALPPRRRPAFCSTLRDLMTDLQATATARAEAEPPLLATPPAGEGGGLLPWGEIPTSCSLVADTPVTILFVNNTSRTVSTYWIGYDCGAVRYSTLEPGQSYVQETFATHPWVVRAAATGEVLAGLVAEASTTVQIGE